MKTKQRQLATNTGRPHELFPIPSDTSFEPDDVDGQIDDNDEYQPSIELMIIGAALIETNIDLHPLKTATIAYLWRRKGGTRAHTLKLGECITPKGITRLYTGLDFIICLSADNCRSTQMTKWQIEALMYHELKHARLTQDEETGQPKPQLNPHDWEGFADEITKYGAWREDIQPVATAFQQLQLFDQPTRSHKPTLLPCDRKRMQRRRDKTRRQSPT